MKFEKSKYATKWEALEKFLSIMREQALQTKVLLSTYQGNETEVKAVKCNNCCSIEHKTKRCPAAKANTTDGKVDALKLKKKQKEQLGKCPLCSEFHTYTRWQDKEEWPTDRLFKCDTFQKQSEIERATTLENLKACAKCTSWLCGPMPW